MDLSGGMWRCCGGLVMKNTWVVFEVKASPSDGASELCMGLFLCSPGNLGYIPVSSALTEPCCLGSILLCSGPMELAGRGLQITRHGAEQGAPSPLCRHMASPIACIPTSSAQAQHEHRPSLCLQHMLCHMPQPGRRGGESVNVPSHNKPLCMGGPET